MKNKVLAAQQEDAARRLVRTALSREGFSPVPGEESGAVEAGERKVIITYQIRVTGSGSTAPVQTITMAAGLSFIGLGVQPPTPEWGAMLSGSRQFMRQAPHLVIFPGLAIAVTVLALNLLGDGLRDALDPKLKN